MPRAPSLESGTGTNACQHRRPVLALRPVHGRYLDLERELPVQLSRQIKPISYLKAHTAEIVRTMSERQEPLIITQNGEAKVVIQDIHSY